VLLGWLREEARRDGLSITLHVEENNPARLWYERLGFVKLEARGVYWFMRWQPDRVSHDHGTHGTP
jgi:ribosomal protein S18 acetylase RimI-like enzyme